MAKGKFTTDEIIIILDVFKSAIKDGLDLKLIFEELHEMFDSPAKASMIHEMGQKIFSEGTISEGFRGILPDNIVEAIGFAYDKGQLDVVLEEIQKIYVVKQNLSVQLKKAISYPAIVLGLFFALMISAFAFIMPIIEKSLKGIDPKKIPEFNKTLFAISHAVRDHYLLLTVVLVAAVFSIFLLLKKYKNEILFNLPIIKDIMQSQENSISFKMLAVFHKAGVNIQKAFFSIAESLTGDFRNVFIETSRMLSEGRTITEAFKNCNVSKKYIVRVKSGEMTSKIEESFEKISMLEQQKAETYISALTRTVNIVMLILAATSGIGFYAITVLPTYKIAGL